MNDIRNNELAAEQYDALQRNLEFISYNNPKIPEYPCTNCTCNKKVARHGDEEKVTYCSVMCENYKVWFRAAYRTYSSKLVPKNYNYIEYRERKEKERNAKNKHS